MIESGIAHLRREAAWAELFERIGPITHKPRRRPTFQSLVQSIIYQQLSGKAAETILGRFRKLFPGKKFPTPEQVSRMSTARMRKAGLSRGKAAYIKDLARHTRRGTVPTLRESHGLTDAELVERLTVVKGVGRWTVEMLLIFNLGRPDVWPVGDLGVRKGFQHVFGMKRLPHPNYLERAAKNWRPHRSTAALYLWQAANLLNASK